MQQASSGEIRQNLLTNRWVIYAPDRAQRPVEMQQRDTNTANLPGRDAQCPFCIGNEQMIPPVILELPAHDGRGWQTRVVPNKYPALRPNVEVAGANRGIYRVTTNYGRHEVVIETPLHNHDIPSMTASEVEAVVETYVRRYRAICCDDETIQTIIVFRNHGPRAGTSLRHPHSQIVATDLVPESIVHRERTGADYYRQNGRCVLCDIIEFERSDRTRLVYENDAFLSFVPFAAEVPCEMWIVPKRHGADFDSIAPHEQRHLAAALQDALQRLRDTLNDPDYNYVIHSSSRRNAAVPYLHWYLQIRPRLTTPAGFEIGSGMAINPSLPERDADALKTKSLQSELD